MTRNQAQRLLQAAQHQLERVKVGAKRNLESSVDPDCFSHSVYKRNSLRTSDLSDRIDSIVTYIHDLEMAIINGEV